MNKTRKQCPLCKKKDWDILYKLNQFNIVQCRICGLTFRDIILDTYSTKELYSQDYFVKQQADYFLNNPRKKEELFLKRMSIVNTYLPQRGKLLDVGCAIGTFLKIANENNYEVKGIEISEFAATYARNKYGIGVTRGEFSKERFLNDKFDVITMWDVVDHAEDPRTFLSDAFSLLADGGFLFVETAMEDSFVYQFSKYIYKLSFGLIRRPVVKGHPVHHSTFFSRSTLRAMLESCGFQIKNIMQSRYSADFFPAGLLTKQVFKLFSGFGDRIGFPLQVIFVAQKKQ